MTRLVLTHANARPEHRSKGFAAQYAYRKLIVKTDAGEKLGKKQRCPDAKLLTAGVFVRTGEKKTGDESVAS